MLDELCQFVSDRFYGTDVDERQLKFCIDDYFYQKFENRAAGNAARLLIESKFKDLLKNEKGRVWNDSTRG